MTQPPWGSPPPGQPPADREPSPPSLTNRQTALPWSQLKQLLHHGEVPWLIVAVAIGLIGYGSMIAFFVLTVVLSLDGVDGFGPTEADGFWYEAAQQITGLISTLFVVPLVIYLARGLLYAQLRSGAVRITPTQFPEAFEMVVEASLSAGLRKIPDAYVLSGNGVINAFASGHGWRRTVTIHSDLFEVGGEARDPDALRFVIGHEVGHLAAGHVSYWRLLLVASARSIPILGGFFSRAQEYTADNFGYRFTGESGGRGVVKLLSAGKYLNANVDFDEFADRALSEKGFFLWVANLLSTHPVMTWRAQALRDRSRQGSLFLRPKGNPSGIGSLPPGSDYSSKYPTPAEAMRFIRAYPPSGAPQFGAVFPKPLPSEEISPGGSSDYGQRQLRAGWQNSGARSGPLPSIPQVEPGQFAPPPPPQQQQPMTAQSFSGTGFSAQPLPRQEPQSAPQPSETAAPPPIVPQAPPPWDGRGRINPAPATEEPADQTHLVQRPEGSGVDSERDADPWNRPDDAARTRDPWLRPDPPDHRR